MDPVNRTLKKRVFPYLQGFLIPYNRYKEVLCMGINYFTDEQILKLKDNPHVKKISNKAITYEESFKELFWNDYQSGMTPTMIFAKYGFEPSVLGERRIGSFTSRIKQQSERLEGFSDTRKGNSGRPQERELSNEELIEKLKQKNKILQQENDFLKRIRSINKKQILEASKTKNRKKSSN